MGKSGKSVSPLQKKSPAGHTYSRTDSTVAKLHEVLGLAEPDLIGRCAVSDPTNGRFVPSECVLYLVRAYRGEPECATFESLFKILITRILQRLPRADRRRSTVMVDESIRDHVLDRMRHHLASDRRNYDPWLDFFEVRFDMGLRRMRATARRSVHRKAAREEPLAGAQSAVSPEAEQSATKLFNERIENTKFGTDEFRFALDAAIDTLREDEARVIHMLRLGIPINSKDSDQVTIARTLNCAEKTVRNMRDRAFVKLRDVLIAGGHW